MEKGYVKAQSDNLPHVDFEMVCEYLNRSVNVEIRHAKTKRASRESYGDNAIGNVQLKRDLNMSTIKARITPEHKVTKKDYEVQAVIDEATHSIIECKCLSCAAAEGDCKHAVAFVFWLHRRSEEPAATEVECYWKKSVLNTVKNKKFCTLSDLVDRDIPEMKTASGNFLAKVKECQLSGGVFDFLREKPFAKLSLHYLVITFKTISTQYSASQFKQHLKDSMSQELCEKAEIATREQYKTSLWYELRYGRITASNFYEAARCKTIGGSLIEKILGASQVFETDATKRGRLLESEVIKEVSEKRHIKINKCGLFINQNYPIFGASPDGVSAEFVIEVKCPSKERTVKNYIDENGIHKKYYFQIQLQMLFTNKKKALFCVASPNFENDRDVDIHEVAFDDSSCKTYLDAAEAFWSANVFPKLEYT